MERLAAWVARQQEGNRNAALYWAAHRALDTSQAADLSPLAAAAANPRGGQRPVRMTCVLVREGRRWAVAQSHASIGVPNAEIFR